jgi:Cathepsin propeptide inhibitor domain (I29).
MAQIVVYLDTRQVLPSELTRLVPSVYAYLVPKLCFQKSLDIIEELNKNRQSPESARYGITEFSDLSEEEFKTRHLRHSVNKHVLMSHHKHHDHHHNHVKKRSITTGITIPTGIPVKKDW